MVVVAKFGKTLGLVGDIYVQSFFSKKLDIVRYTNFFLKNGEIISVSFKQANSKIVGKVCGVNSIDKAKNYTGKLILLKKTELPKLKPNQFYYEELINMCVFLKKKKIGIIRNVLNHGAGDYFEIKVNNSEIAVPFNKEHIIEINKKEKTVFLNPLYYEF